MAPTEETILEMDNGDDEREFSKEIVYGFFDQAEATFISMEDNLKDKNLSELSSLGHFLKGSSATLGLSKVKEGCEKIQHYGAGKDETGSVEQPDKNISLQNIGKTLVEVKQDYEEVEGPLWDFYKYK